MPIATEVAPTDNGILGIAKSLSFMKKRVKTQAETIGLTVSIGVTHRDSTQATLSEMMKKADEFMYEAKRSGRNRVVATI